MRKPTIHSILTLLTLLTIRCPTPLPAAPPPVIAQTIQVHDGDTMRCSVGTRMLKVRLWGIDAPELAQPYGTSATLELRRLTATTTFTLQVRSRDRYGRTVAILTLPDGRRVNTLMVQSGAAWWYPQYARKAADLMAAEVQARADHRGLWRDPDPTPPWTFRAAQRATTRKR